MPRTAIPVVELTTENGLAISSFTNADQANDHEIANPGSDVLLIARCIAGSAQTLTVPSITTPDGFSKSIAIVAPANGLVVFGPFRAALWNTSGLLYLNLTDNTGVTFCAVKIYPAR